MESRPIVVFVALALVTAQDTRPPGAVIRIEVNLVQIDTVVTDSKGRHIPGLTEADFQILQDGKQQVISGVSYIGGTRTARSPNRLLSNTPSVPLPPLILKRSDVQQTIAMVVDDLGLSIESMAHVRDALKKFVDQQMQPGDSVAIMRTSAGMGAFQQFTGDKSLLHAAIERIRFSLFSRVGAFNSSDFNDLMQVGSLGALRYAVDGLSQLPGRKSVILFSENMPLADLPDMQDSLRHLVDAANRSSVVFYTVDPRGLQPFFPGAGSGGVGVGGHGPRARGPHADGVASVMESRENQMFRSQAGMFRLAQETGGLFIHDDNYVDDAIRQAVDDSDGYYLIGYRPDDATFTSGRSKFHKVRVLVDRPGLKVRTRAGFFGIPDSQRSAYSATPEEQLRQALASPFATGDIHVRLTTLFTNTAAQNSALDGLLHIDARDLRFSDLPDGSREARVDVLATIFGDKGEVETIANRSWSIQAGTGDFDKVLAEGLLCTIHHPIRKPGAYQMRVAVRDATSELLGSASQFIQVPDLSRGRLALSSLMLPGAGGNAAVRVFPPGATVNYEYRIFNAQEGGTRRPEIEVQTRIFRDGTEIYTGQRKPLGRADWSDAARVIAGGQFQLSSQIAPGGYVFQLIVTDKLIETMPQIATQWMDFEVAR